MITCFTDGVALICAIPSKSNNGLYLVDVRLVNDQIEVTHACPSQRFKNTCTHIHDALQLFYRWRWWEPKRTVIMIEAPITLSPEWEQIPEPDSVAAIAAQMEEDDPYGIT